MMAHEWNNKIYPNHKGGIPWNSSTSYLKGGAHKEYPANGIAVLNKSTGEKCRTLQIIVPCNHPDYNRVSYEIIESALTGKPAKLKGYPEDGDKFMFWADVPEYVWDMIPEVYAIHDDGRRKKKISKVKASKSVKSTASSDSAVIDKKSNKDRIEEIGVINVTFNNCTINVTK